MSTPAAGTASGSGSSAPTAARGRGRPPTHGLSPLRRAVQQLAPHALDRRTVVGKALSAWRAALVRDLGGDVSTQQAALIELAVRTKLLLDRIDTWLLRQPRLVDGRRRAVLPVVRERQQLADALARYLAQLGLERRAEPVPDLTAYLRTRGEQGAGSPSAGSGPTEPARKPEAAPP